MRTGLSRGFPAAAAAGAGTASADLVYAGLAIALGGAAASVLAPALPVVRVVAALALAVLALRGMRERPSEATDQVGRSTFLTFLVLTLLNPLTIVIFAAIAVALPDITGDLGARGAFVAGAFLASLSWQELLAAIGGVLNGRLSARAQRASGFVSAAIVLALAARVLIG